MAERGFDLTDDRFKEMSIDLLIDILATNKDILDYIEAIHQVSSNEDMMTNRELIIEYLYSKYGKTSESLKDFLENQEISPNDDE